MNRKVEKIEDLLSYYCELVEVVHHGHSTIEALNDLTKHLPQKDKEFVWVFTDNLRHTINILMKNRLVLDDGESWPLTSSSTESISDTEEFKEDLLFNMKECTLSTSLQEQSD